MSTTGTAIVTGGSQRIGAGLVTRFLEKGYNVVGNSRAITKSTNLTPSPRLALVDGDRMGEIDEVVDAVMYLNDATFVTGEVLHVDGGAQAGKW